MTNPLYILVVFFLSILLLPSVFLSVTWYQWIYYVTDNNKQLGKIKFVLLNENKINSFIKADKYTLAYNLSLLSAIFLCPISGFIFGYRAERGKYIKREYFLLKYC